MPTETDEKISETAIAERPAKVPVLMGVAPKSIEEAWRLAGFFASSDLVPKAYRGKQADVLVAIQYGMELGFPPMQALQSIAVIGARPSVWGDGFLALIMASPLYQNHDEYYEVAGDRRDGLTADDLKRDDTAAVCTFWRRGKPQPVTRRFTIAQAKKAQLWTKEGPWQQYPDRQLAMRARGFAGRDCFPDLLRGIRTAEEVRDIPESEVIDVPPPPVQPRRASAAPVPATPPVTHAMGRDAHEAATEHAAKLANTAAATTERGLLITHTALVQPAQGDPYFEITLKTGTGADRIVVTRDEALYREAASFEGTDHAGRDRFTTHEAPRADLNGSRVRVLDYVDHRRRRRRPLASSINGKADGCASTAHPGITTIFSTSERRRRPPSIMKAAGLYQFDRRAALHPRGAPVDAARRCISSVTSRTRTISMGVPWRRSGSHIWMPGCVAGRNAPSRSCLCEYRVASRRHRVAGTIDLLCTIGDDGWLLDYCTGDLSDAHKDLQTASYLGLAFEWAQEESGARRGPRAACALAPRRCPAAEDGIVPLRRVRRPLRLSHVPDARRGVSHPPGPRHPSHVRRPRGLTWQHV